VTNRPDGTYDDIKDAEYHGNAERLSSTGARLLLPPSVPEMFKYRQQTAEKPKRIYDVGTITHHLVLGKGATFEVLDPAIHGLNLDGSPSANPRGTKSWKAAESDARRAGKVPIHENDFDAAVRMTDSILSHTEAAAILLSDSGKAEMSLYATDPVWGVQLRARPDWMDGEELDDVKTAVSAHPATFARHAAKFGYHIQAAFYRRAAQLLGIAADPRFRFVVVEKEPPHLVSVVEYDDEAKAEGDREVDEAIRTYAACMASGRWPGYDEGTHPISLPLWALDDEDEMEFAD
jgi:hypothetical protein